MSSAHPTNHPPFSAHISKLFREVAEKWEQMRKAVEPVEPLRDNVGKTPDRFAMLAERVRLLSDSSATYKRLARLPRLSEVPELRDNVEAQLDMLANTISHLQEVPSDCIDWVVHYSHYDDSNYNVISQCAAEIHYQSGLLMSQLEDTFSG
jgi:DNA repair ATPase RecN